MKKLKRLRFLALAATIGILFTGCGSNSSSEANGGGSDTGASAAASDGSTEETVNVKTIKAATMGSPIPYMTIDEDGNVDGYDIRVLKEVFNRLPQYDLEIVVTDIGSVFTGISTDVYDIGVNNFSYNEERAKSYLYSFPYDTISYVFVSKDGSVGSFADAAGKKVTAQAGISVTNAMEQWNEANPDKAIKIEYIEGGTNQAQQVYDGQIDFVLFDKAMYVEYEKEYNYGLKAVDVPAEEAKTIAENSYTYYLFSLENTELRSEINAVLKELRDDGTLTKLSEEVFGFDAAPPADRYETPIN